MSVHNSNVNRRTMLLGLGGLAAGGGALFSTGAFTTVEAERSVSIETAGDADAFFALEPGDTEYVTYDDGLLEINIDGESAPGDGVNMDARTAFGSVEDGPYDRPNDIEENHAFEIRNQGTQTYETLSLTYEPEDASWLTDDDFDTYPPQTECFILRFIPSGQHPTSAHYDLKAPSPIGNSADTFYNGVYTQDDALDTVYGGQTLAPGESVLAFS